jgi:hypothetical protein
MPASGVAAALLNVTVTNTTMPSYLTVYPQGGAPPLVSNLNWVAGETVPNRVVVPVSATGQITVYNAQGHTDVVVDVDGYFTDGSSTPTGASLFGVVNPVRVLDTRLTGQTLGAGGTITQTMAGVDGIASNATAVVTNMTATDTTAPSYFTVYPGGGPPVASDLNWVASQTEPNLTVATLSNRGSVSVYNAQGRVDLIIDAFGYFVPEVPSPVVILTNSLPAATIGSAYSATLAAYGGTPPYSWAVIAGSLPSSLTLSSGGVISGTPTSSATYDLSVEATDSTTPTAQTATQALSLTVDLAPPSAQTSGNWSGYVMQNGPYSEADGLFVVPSLYSTDQVGTCMSEWVGIDGFSNRKLIQAGIIECPDPNVPGYFDLGAWWEILPASSTFITTWQNLAPGDLLEVRINQVGATTWGITVTDHTQSESFTTNQTYNGPAQSAEWIVEAPTVNGSQVALAGYTETSFAFFSAMGPQNNVTRVIMVQNGVQVSTPSTLDSTSFNVAYGSVTPSPP